MPEPRSTPPRELVRRALEAAEIADGCYDMKIRKAFFSLASLRLLQAEASFRGEAEPPPETPGDD